MNMNKLIIIFLLIGLVFLPFMETLGRDVSRNIHRSSLLNTPPTKPVLTGVTSGETGTSYTYTAVSTDPDGDAIVYCFDWGDGTDGLCTTPRPSGEEASVTHTWSADGDYVITCKASDPTGAESEPATLRVSMPTKKDSGKLAISQPKNGLYIHGTKIMPLIGQIVIGDIEIMVDTSNAIEKVEFRVTYGNQMDSILSYVDITSPFIWNKDKNTPFPSSQGIKVVQITAIGYDAHGEKVTDNVSILQI